VSSEVSRPLGREGIPGAGKQKRKGLREQWVSQGGGLFGFLSNRLGGSKGKHTPLQPRDSAFFQSPAARGYHRRNHRRTSRTQERTSRAANLCPKPPENGAVPLKRETSANWVQGGEKERELPRHLDRSCQVQKPRP